MAKLNHTQIMVYKRYLSGWVEVGNQLRKNYTFDNYRQAIDFMCLVGNKAKEQKHVPELHLKDCCVSLSLYTVDEEGKGITGRDFALAMTAEKIYQQSRSPHPLQSG